MRFHPTRIVGLYIFDEDDEIYLHPTRMIDVFPSKENVETFGLSSNEGDVI